MGKTVLPQHKRVNIHRASFSIQILKIFEGDGSVNGKVCLKSSVPTVNMANAIFEQILLISDNGIKYAYFYIRVILNTVKKMLKHVSARLLYRNNSPSDLQQNLD